MSSPIEIWEAIRLLRALLKTIVLFQCFKFSLYKKPAFSHQAIKI